MRLISRVLTGEVVRKRHAGTVRNLDSLSVCFHELGMAEDGVRAERDESRAKPEDDPIASAASRGHGHDVLIEPKHVRRIVRVLHSCESFVMVAKGRMDKPFVVLTGS